MKQTIYCSTFYCEHYENGKCLSPVLHVSNVGGCKEFNPSDEKLDAHLKTQANNPNKPTEYGEYDLPHITFRIRQK
ncbi:MAG: hypothetical protein IKK54_00500 [Anaerotignum sp.]|nr:hypothetical protein [Anaerotignum sp.]